MLVKDSSNLEIHLLKIEIENTGHLTNAYVLKDKKTKAEEILRFLLCFFNESVGAFRTADFDFSASPGNSYFLSAGRTFKMSVSFLLLKIRF